ncbi:MAG: GNAT family N-acetyltransferase [Eudoraea sp.]|uniref:GNAT family N-acetyltransferase n=1 Tax=Eudoraea sp. TaxID=1979955 RepID=UPI003265C5D3
MDNITVRKAKIEDLETLLNFEQGIIKVERPYDPTMAKDPITYYDLKELILSDKAEVVVATYNSELIASGYVQIRNAKPYLNHELYAYLGFMYTHPDFRGKGINKKVVDTLVKWSKSKNIQEVRLTVYEENIGAIKAYEKVGFKKHLIEMRIE